MFQHYILTALRAMRRQRLYTAINVTGLSLGTAVVLLLALYVVHEMSFDEFHAQGDRIYRVNVITANPDGSERNRDVRQPIPLAPALEAELAGVEAAVRLYADHAWIRADQGKEPLVQRILFSDATFFEVFSVPLLEGDPEQVLKSPSGMVISASAALRIFGSTDVMGRSVELSIGDTYWPVLITGVSHDAQGPTSIPTEVILPFKALEAFMPWFKNNGERWNVGSVTVFTLLSPGAEEGDSEQALNELYARYNSGGNRSVQLQPIADIHLDPGVRGGFIAPREPRHIGILAAIGLLILVLACINFTTLAVGRATRRIREIGLRKAVGASRMDLAIQFLGEALLFGVLGAFGGIILAELGLPIFHSLSGSPAVFNDHAWLHIVTPGAGMLIGLIAGSYPALVLARLRPVDSMRPNVRLAGNGRVMRGLVVIQYVVSIGLVMGVTVMHAQLSYLNDKELGFDSDNVLVVQDIGFDGTEAVARLRTELDDEPGILSVSGISHSFGRETERSQWTHDGVAYSGYFYNVTSNVFQTLDIRQITGRQFLPGSAADSSHSVVVNESMARQLGYGPEEAIGKTLDGYGRSAEDAPEIIGVVGDFHFLPLQRQIEPMVFTMNRTGGIREALIRYDPGTKGAPVQTVRRAYAKASGDRPFSHSFVDEDLNAHYATERQWTSILRASSILALFIASMGLFGLSAFSVERRRKELGMRKILGASTGHIYGLVGNQFMVLVLVASLMAVPLAWVLLNRWLDTFAFRIDISWWMPAAAVAISLCIAMVSVLWQSVSAAAENPVKAVRET